MSNDDNAKLRRASECISSSLVAIEALCELIKQADGPMGLGLFELLSPHSSQLCEGLELLDEVALR